MAEGRDPKLSQSKNNSSTAPSTSLTPLRSCKELCVVAENLPNKDIAQLWNRPLKIASSQTHSNPSSPIATSQNVRRRSKNQPRTPSRRNILPPTKLVFQHGESPNADENATAKTRFGTRRSMSFPESGAFSDTPVVNPKRFKLFNEEISPYEDLINSKPNTLKDSNGSSSLTPSVRKLFLKSQSDSVLSTSIKTAVEKIGEDPNLIGDGTSAYILPIKKDGKHQDLKEITAETLSTLIESKEDCAGVTFKVIDCRYPYEFEGGHIRGALNLYTKKLIQDELMEYKTSLNDQTEPDSQKVNIREILIFHCEFSSRRGPSLCRYLRDIDRNSNASTYPSLFYPELYVLYGGYKDFFEQFPHLCDPSAYVPMSHPQHADKYRKYKNLSKLGFCA